MKFTLLVGTPRSTRGSMTNYGATNVQGHTMDGTMTLGSAIDTLHFEISDPNNNIIIHEGFDIILEETGTASNRFFGGVVQTVRYKEVGFGRSLIITAQDWTMLLDKSTIRKIYEVGGQLGSHIIKDAFLEAGLKEIETGSHVQDDRPITAMNFQGTSLASILNQMADITGYVWYVDSNKFLHYHPETFTVGKHFSDNPDNSTTFPYYDFALRKELADWNAVELLGGSGLSDDITETYTGDGATKIFITGQETGTNPIHFAADGLDIITVELNTGSQGSPTWTAQTVKLEDEPGITLGSNADVLWNPIFRRLEFDTAPLNGSNGFRVTGRYHVPIITINQDTASVAKHGRVFKSSLVVPETLKVEEAQDLAIAYLREHTDKVVFQFSSNEDQSIPGDVVKLTHTAFGLNADLGLVERVNYRIVGGELVEYEISGVMINRGLYR